MIYLDNASTTKPYKEVLEEFNNINEKEFFNISAMYNESFVLSKKVDETRNYFLSLINGRTEDKVIFTSGATESNNLAIFGSTHIKNGRYLFSSGEHPSVYNCAMHLLSLGYKVEFIPLKKNGQIDYEYLEKTCDENVAFISTMFVNNETGAINDVCRISSIVKTKSPKAIFHVDAVQALCKIKIDVKSANIDLLSVSAHKIGGLKSCGALYISKNIHLKQTSFGGGQEYGLRSGTVNSSGILTFGKALQLSSIKMEENFKKALELKQYLISKLNIFKNAIVTSDNNCSPYIISILFNGNRGETIQRFLNSKGIIVGTGSACSSKKMGNRILQEMGYKKDEILGAIRISLFNRNTKEEIDTLCSYLEEYFKTINT